MSRLILEWNNFLTAPFTDFMINQYSCPLSVKFGTYFHDYYYILYIILLLLWSLFYFIFKKLSLKLLRRIGLSVQRTRKVSAALWSAGASLGSSLLSASQLETYPWIVLSLPSDNIPPPHLSMYLIVLAVYLSHRALSNFFRRGLFSRQTFSDLSQLAILPSIFIARWLELGFSIMTILGIVQTIYELARMGISLRKGRHDNSFSLFVLYSIIWCFTYIWYLPLMIIIVLTTPMESDQHSLGLTLLFISLSIHVIVSWIFSPLLPAVKGYITNRSTAEWLQIALFPGTDEKMLQVRKLVQEKKHNMELLSRKNSFIKAKILEQKAPTPKPRYKEAKALIQTVRCVTLLKRKIKIMREKKANESINDDDTSKIEELPNTSLEEDTNELTAMTDTNSEKCD